MHYLRKETTAYYECDQNNLLKPSGMMRYMQQTSSEHLCSIDISVEKLSRENLVFLLSKYNIKIHRPPVCNEKLIIGTALTEVKGPRFVREFFIDSADGKRLVSALSLWILCDTKHHKILRPSAFPYPLSIQPSQLNGAVEDISMPKGTSDEPYARIEIPTRYSHIDVNRHVNNCFYADFICDVLPFDEHIKRGISTLAVSFQNETNLGETLEITATRLSPLSYKICGTHAGQRRFEGYVELCEN